MACLGLNLFRVNHPRRERRYRPRGLNIDGLFDDELRARYRFGRNAINKITLFYMILFKWPGSIHDSHIFNTSQIFQQLEDNHNGRGRRL